MGVKDKKYSYSSVLEDFVCLSVEVLLFYAQKTKSEKGGLQKNDYGSKH